MKRLFLRIAKNSRFIRYYWWMPVSRKIRDKFNNPVIKFFLIALIFPVVLVKWISFFKKPKEENEFRYEYAVTAIAKNEAPYIKEWVEYHAGIGFEKFYIYNNNSTDDIYEVLEPYIQSGLVEYTDYPGRKRQCFSYNDSVEKHKHECRYMAVIDLDEFIVPFENGNISTAGNLIGNNGGLVIHWCCFGSSGYEKQPDGGVLDSYLYRAEDSFMHHIAIKTIFNPRKVICVSNPHFPCYYHGIVSVNENGNTVKGPIDYEVTYKKIRINHYFCKSQEEFRKKIDRGMGDVDGKRKWDKFIEYDKNEVYDDEILRFRKN